MNLEKLKEAEEWRLKASKMLKTSLFGNWQPDHLSAAPYFDKAAALYKAAGAVEQSKNAYVQCAECNEKTSTYAAAAMAYKNASQMAKEDDDEGVAAEFLAREADMWVLHGDSGRAADSLVKAGVVVEDSSPSKAVEYCMQAIDFLMPDHGDPMELAKAPLANDVFSKSLTLCLRNEKISDALKVCRKAGGVLAAQGLNSSLFKMYCTETILQLYLGDVVAADKAFMEVHLQHSGYLRAIECECAEDLLTAAKAMDGPALAETVNKLSRAYLDNAVIRIARRLSVDRISGGLGGEGDEEDEAEGEGGLSFVRTLPQNPGPGSSTSPSDGAALSTRPAPSSPPSSVQPSWANASASSAFCFPAPGLSPPPAVVVEEDVSRPRGLSSSSQDGLMDLSDLQAGLEEADEREECKRKEGEEEDELDTAIREAKAAAHHASWEGHRRATAPSVPKKAVAGTTAASPAQGDETKAAANAVSATTNPFAVEDEDEGEVEEEVGKEGGVMGVDEVEEDDFDLR
ncbi:soluble nsf attachment protein gamma isoform [Nannochloropsis oceanica]